MQIDGNSSVAFSAYRSSDVLKKADLPQGQSFLQMVQDMRTGAIVPTAESAEVSAEDEMRAFKTEIYMELAQINSMNSSAVLSNSVHITEGGFQRMKDDPEYRKEIMDWLRADARASHGLPYGEHVTTTITEHGATSFGMNVYPEDSAATRASKKQMADSRAEGAFYHSARKKQRKVNDAFWLRAQQNRDAVERMLLERRLDQQIAEQRYLDMLGTQQNGEWSILQVLSGI